MQNFLPEIFGALPGASYTGVSVFLARIQDLGLAPSGISIFFSAGVPALIFHREPRLPEGELDSRATLTPKRRFFQIL